MIGAANKPLYKVGDTVRSVTDGLDLRRGETYTICKIRKSIGTGLWFVGVKEVDERQASYSANRFELTKISNEERVATRLAELHAVS